MNKRETARLTEVLSKLQQGPGNGWRQILAGLDGEEALNVDRRERQLRLWLDTWIIPPLDDVTTRYGKAYAARVLKKLKAPTCAMCGSAESVTRQAPLDNDGDRPDEWVCSSCDNAWPVEGGRL